ncbi:hypothetical protein HDU80_002964 [Chytriomyces hyalinus]|nr:hypothetical protein HDU80_002964 [Chytriomyces hyalinus]
MLSLAKPDCHTLIKLFLQGCLPDDRKELVKHSIDSSRVLVTDFDKFLDHMDTQDSHNQMLDQVAGGLSVREKLTMPNAVVDLLRYNTEHMVRLVTLAKVANIVSRKVASEESAVYWNLGNRPAGTKYNMYRTSTAAEWDPSMQYSTQGSPYICGVVFQEMFKVD